MKTIGYLDTETKKLFQDVGGYFPEKLGLAIAGVLVDNQEHLFTEENIEGLFQLLDNLDCIVGHNLFFFDYKVIQPYADFDVRTKYEGKTVDTLAEIEKITGIRMSLDNLCMINFNTGKNGHCIEIPGLWAEGKKDIVIGYLKNDLKLSKMLFEAGLKGKIKVSINGVLKEIEPRWGVQTDGLLSGP